jgi:HAD superfamily hydrolase (TIGR01509 family)
MRAVIFDRDNTLLYFDQDAIGRLDAEIQRIAPAIQKGLAAAAWMAWSGPWPATEDEEPAFWRAFWGEFARFYQLSQEQATALETIGGFYHTCFRAFPDTLPTISLLRRAGVRLAVLSNYELPSVHHTMRSAGVDPAYFDALLSSAAIGARKPDPRAYAAAAAALGLSPSECVFVDDLAENVEGAQRAGMRAYLLDRDMCHTTAEHPRLRSLLELAEQCIV